MLARPGALVRKVIGCAIEVHRALGPGLLESTYQVCFGQELTYQNVAFRREVPVPVVYRGVALDCAYRVDFLIEGVLVVEVKSTNGLLPVHTSQVLTYLRLLDLHQGLLLNFNVPVLTKGMRNIVR
jgi:GxxExxY protein